MTFGVSAALADMLPNLVSTQSHSLHSGDMEAEQQCNTCQAHITCQAVMRQRRRCITFAAELLIIAVQQCID